MLEKFINYLLFALRGKSINVAPELGINYVISNLLSKGFFPFLRGLFWRIFFKKTSGFVFVGGGVKIINPSKLSCGKNFYVGQYSYLDFLSLEGVIVGDSVTIREGAWLQITSSYANPGVGITIGDNVYIGPRCILGAAAPVSIGDRCQIGANVSIVAENHKFAAGSDIFEQGVTRKGIRIGKDCWIGNGVIILDGVNIGDGSVIGAGSVVTKSVPPMTVAVGNPAKVIKERLVDKC